jgi:type III pantothenate kinase
VVASVHPPRLARFLDWARADERQVVVLARAGDLPLPLHSPSLAPTGIDRLLAAVAVDRLRDPQRPAVIVHAGTALVVDLLDADGIFLGGAIGPGPRLMALSLHQQTALLPCLDQIPDHPNAPGTNTTAAIELGIHSALIGGVNHLIGRYTSTLGQTPDVFLTGGAARLLASGVAGRIVPHLVLEGIRLTAEGLP